MPSHTPRVPKIVDDRLAIALSHDTREHALSVCSVRPTSTKEIATELDVSISAAWHHVKTLRELGCIEEVESKRRRGATERFYVTTSAFYFDSDAWERVPDDRRKAIVMRILRLIARDVDEAVRAETVEADGRHLSRLPVNLDAEGQEEAYAVLTRALEDLLAVRKKCVARVDARSAETMRTSFVLMQLELPSGS